jgi:hypothetical protein
VLDDLICSKVVDIVSHDELEADFLVVFNQLGALSIQNVSARPVHDPETKHKTR